MKRSAALTALLVLLAGCNSSPSSVNLLAPYGSTRVPPPATGAYKRPDSYYQPATQPGNAGGASLGDANGKAATSLAAADSVESQPGAEKAPSTANSPAKGDIRLVSAAEPKTTVTGSQVQPAPSRGPSQENTPVRVVESGRSEAATSPPIKGMPVNDATRSAEPRPFVPAQPLTDLSQLPKSAGLTPPPASGTSGSSSTSASDWKTR